MLMTDRVSERRRAAQVARHYRDQEDLTIAEIARRLGRAEATVKAYLYDPTGVKAREVKERYRGVRRGCGAPTSAQRQRRRVRVLQTLPSRSDRAAMDPRAGARSNARLACPVRQPADVLRLVAHPRTPTRRRSAQRTTDRRMARAVHCDRSVRELGAGRRRRLRPRLNAWASIAVDVRTRLRLTVREKDAEVTGNASARSTAPARPADRRPAGLPPTSTNVSVDSMTGTGRRVWLSVRG